VPRVVFEDHRHHLLGMSAVPQPHDNLKDLLLRGDVDLTVIRALAKLLATVHVRSASRSDELAVAFADRSTFEELRLAPYYGYTAKRVRGARDFLYDLMGAARSQRIALVHGDYSPKNVLVHRGRLVLLDHEVVHFGDPAFDVGFSLTHLLSKAHHLKSRAMSEAAAEYGRTYLMEAGRLATADLQARAARHAVGCLMARVAGRSPLEYLDTRSRERQLEVAVRLAAEPPDTIDGLVGRFFRLLSERGWVRR
jgi:tRNA A-37 threonylcarbamoyl transferase component Bud32